MPGEDVWKRWRRKFDWLRGSPRRARCALCPDFLCHAWKKSLLIQHERSKLHASSAGRSCCPSSAAFENMVAERRKGTSLRKSREGPFKTVKMLWCANEAVKEVLKTKIQRCITASISQDGQGASLGVRMCVVSHGKGDLTWSHVICPGYSCHPDQWTLMFGHFIHQCASVQIRNQHSNMLSLRDWAN